MCDLGGIQAAATKRVKLGQTLLMAVGAAAAGALRCQLIMVMPDISDGRWNHLSCKPYYACKFQGRYKIINAHHLYCI